MRELEIFVFQTQTSNINVSVNSSGAHPPVELAISGKKMAMSPPQRKKNCS
jgi:hypothetical protein